MDERKKTQGGPPDRSDLNQGEGNKTADKQYRDRAGEYARQNDTLGTARKAEREVENYRDDFDRAEQEGRRHSAGDLPKDLGKK